MTPSQRVWFEGAVVGTWIVLFVSFCAIGASLYRDRGRR